MNLLKSPITDSDFVQSLIPQKHPFVMVDKLLFYSDNKVISGFTITEDNISCIFSFIWVAFSDHYQSIVVCA